MCSAVNEKKAVVSLDKPYNGRQLASGEAATLECL